MHPPPGWYSQVHTSRWDDSVVAAASSMTAVYSASVGAPAFSVASVSVSRPASLLFPSTLRPEVFAECSVPARVTCGFSHP